jgi:hypothetical protein
VTDNTAVKSVADILARHRAVRTRENMLLADGPVCEAVSHVLLALNERLAAERRRLAAASKNAKRSANPNVRDVMRDERKREKKR